jgi:hypothetical protein
MMALLSSKPGRMIVTWAATAFAAALARTLVARLLASDEATD